MTKTLKPQGEIHRQIGLTSAAAIVAGEVIAVGIFLTPTGSNSGSSAGRFQIPGYPIPPIVFLTLVALLLILLGANYPKQALLGLLVAAVGWPAYHLFTRRGRSDETESD